MLWADEFSSSAAGGARKAGRAGSTSSKSASPGRWRLDVMGGDGSGIRQQERKQEWRLGGGGPDEEQEGLRISR